MSNNVTRKTEKSTNHRVVLLGVIAIVVLFVVSYVLLVSKKGDLTDSEIRKELMCDRRTANVMGTDYYCAHPELYRKDKAANTLLDDEWSKAQTQLRERGLR